MDLRKCYTSTKRVVLILLHNKAVCTLATVPSVPLAVNFGITIQRQCSASKDPTHRTSKLIGIIYKLGIYISILQCYPTEGLHILQHFLLEPNQNLNRIYSI